jgi:hypothetical protein
MFWKLEIQEIGKHGSMKNPISQSSMKISAIRFPPISKEANKL